jgi:hypothetical protein
VPVHDVPLVNFSVGLQSARAAVSKSLRIS